MKKHSKSIVELAEMAKAIHDELITHLPFAVSYNELYETQTWSVNKTTAMIHMNTMEKITQVVKKEGYFGEIKSACIPSQQHLMPSQNEKFQGLYIFSIKGEPIYIGISRNVFERIKQHVFGKTHYSASLAYRIEKEEVGHEGRRKELEGLTNRQEKLREDLRINVIPIKDAYEMYWLEVTLAGMLGTKHNEFETH